MKKHVEYSHTTYKDRILGECIHVAISNGEKMGWSDIQEAKNKILGEEVEAIQVHPAKSKLIDNDHVYHLWVLPICREIDLSNLELVEEYNIRTGII